MSHAHTCCPQFINVTLCTCLAIILSLLVVSRQPLEGYVQMSSAGSVHPSKSLGDIASAGEEEQDTGIYVEPDRTGAALLMQAE